MTRLIPTRDRAQATRYGWSQAKRIRATLQSVDSRCSTFRVKFCIEPVNGGTEWIVGIVERHFPTRFLSGPWYVREVAE